MIIEEHFPSFGGMWPLQLFEASRMYPSFCHLPNQYGRIPINRFCAIKNERRDGFASVSGRKPVRELKVNTTFLKFLHLPSFIGIEPFRLAFTRLSIVGFMRVSNKTIIQLQKNTVILFYTKLILYVFWYNKECIVANLERKSLN